MDALARLGIHRRAADEPRDVQVTLVSTLPALGVAGGIGAIAFAALWRRQVRTQNATSVDAAWSAAIGLFGLAFAAVGTGHPAARVVAAAIAVGWSARLTTHLVCDRLLRHSAEDGRYRALRAHWGARANARFFWFYQGQAAVALLFAVPFLWIAHGAEPLTGVQWLGVVVVVVSQWVEWVADRQLAAHRASPGQRGRTCRRGLWRWSRHPNYFCEWLTWCGIGLVAAPAAGWLAITQPALMFVLVRYVSGVPFAEQQALRSRGDDYRRYQRETNTFFPWFPRRVAEASR